MFRKPNTNWCYYLFEFQKLHNTVQFEAVRIFNFNIIYHKFILQMKNCYKPYENIYILKVHMELLFFVSPSYLPTC